MAASATASTKDNSARALGIIAVVLGAVFALQDRVAPQAGDGGTKAVPAPPHSRAGAERIVAGPAPQTVGDELTGLVRGLDGDLARRLLWGAGLRVEQADTVPGSQQPAGIALGTTPAAGDSVTTGGTVVLHISKGKR